ncbi:MAG: alpha/beta hydrolase [Gammaproteobacteria bacterium]
MLLVTLVALTTGSAAQAVGKPFVLNNTEVIPLASKFTHRRHELVVVLPASYATNPRKTYPVLYYLDAYWDTPLLVSTYGNLSYDNEVPEFIMVGLSYPSTANYDRERRIDYTLSATDKLSGGADAFLNLIAREAAPLVEQRFRAEKSGRVIAGSSLGGLFALTAAYKLPDFFAAHIALSPAVVWDEGALGKVDDAHASAGKPLGSRMFISYGTKEYASFRDPIIAFQKRLQERRYEGLDLMNYAMEGLDHTAVKGDGFVRGLIWAFKDRKPAGPSGLTRALSGAQ